MKARILQVLLGAVGPLILHILNTLINKGTLEKAVDLAKLQVERLMGDNSLDNDAKRKAAVAGLKAELSAIGLHVTGSMLNLAVELAYAAVKSRMPS